MLDGRIDDDSVGAPLERLERALHAREAELAAIDTVPELRDVLRVIERRLNDPYELWRSADLAGKACSRTYGFEQV